MAGYTAVLKDGREIYIPNWPINVALENLTLAGKYLGSEHIINIADRNLASVIVAITESKEPKQAAKLVEHFVCQTRIEGNKITSDNIDSMFEGKLAIVAEIFSHVVHSQYSDFFELGLVKEVSQDN